MAATRNKIEVEMSSDLKTRLRHANDIIRVLNGYIQQQGEIDQGSLVFAERAIKLYRNTQDASSAAQTLRGQLLDLSWSLVTRLWSDPTDERHARRERLAKERCHPPLHDGTEGELLYFALRYVHLAKKARQSSKVDDSWPDDVDEMAKYLLNALRKRDPDPDPALLAQIVFCVLGEGAPGIAQIGGLHEGRPEQIEDVLSAGALWLGIDESRALEPMSHTR
jgi:hypothetical protein